jgi:repressor of nif and glnA expression
MSHNIISSTDAHREFSLSTFISNASAIIDAVSKSTFEFILTIIQFFINSAISLGKTIPIFSDNSLTDKKSQI